MPESDGADRPRDESEPEAHEAQQLLRTSALGGEEQRPEHQRRSSGVNVKVVKLDRRADHRSGQYPAIFPQR